MATTYYGMGITWGLNDQQLLDNPPAVIMSATCSSDVTVNQPLIWDNAAGKEYQIKPSAGGETHGFFAGIALQTVTAASGKMCSFARPPSVVRIKSGVALTIGDRVKLGVAKLAKFNEGGDNENLCIGDVIFSVCALDGDLLWIALR